MTASNFPAAPAELTVEEARALADAGYMPVSEYVRTYNSPKLCTQEDDDGHA